MERKTELSPRVRTSLAGKIDARARQAATRRRVAHLVAVDDTERIIAANVIVISIRRIEMKQIRVRRDDAAIPPTLGERMLSGGARKKDGSKRKERRRNIGGRQGQGKGRGDKEEEGRKSLNSQVDENELLVKLLWLVSLAI